MTNEQHDGHRRDDDQAEERADGQDKAVYLVAAFPLPDQAPDGPVSGMANDVVAVVAVDGEDRHFAWVGADCDDSVANPALVTSVRVEVGVPSPWHPADRPMATGLVRLADDQLGTGPVADDVEHLLAELARSRNAATPRSGPADPEPAPADPAPTPIEPNQAAG
ncbi:MAG: hypothetical protein AAF547_20800 [Actinomycetota bacterium]